MTRFRDPRLTMDEEEAARYEAKTRRIQQQARYLKDPEFREQANNAFLEQVRRRLEEKEARKFAHTSPNFTNREARRMAMEEEAARLLKERHGV